MNQNVTLLAALAINQFFGAAKRIRKYYHAIELTSGALHQLTIITRYLQPYLPVF